MRANSIAAVVAMVALAAPVWAASLHSSARQDGLLIAAGTQSENSNQRPSNKDSLSQEDRQHYGDWLRENRSLSPAEQEKRLEQDPYFKRLPPDRQDQLRYRLKRFNSFSPEKQKRILHRMDMIRSLPPEKQKEIHEIFRQFRELPSDRKLQLRRTLRQMRSMTPKEREQFLQSPLTASHFTEQEMELLRGLNSLDFFKEEK